jgi:NADH dehydrogenase FAD-containing subunit
MGPGMLGGFYSPEEARFPIRRIVEKQGGRFIQDQVVRIDPGEGAVHCASGACLPYDVASFNVGSGVPGENLLREPRDNVVPVKPVENLSQAREKIRASVDLRVVVIGGGPAGVEVSGNAAALRASRNLHISLVAGRRLLAGFPAAARNAALRSLRERGVEVFEGAKADQVQEKEVRLQGGRSLPYDLCFIATGVRPPHLFEPSGMPTGNDGGLAVNRHLQCSRYPRIFGGGDCVHFLPRPLDKVGVHAVRQGPVLRHNLLAALEGRPLKAFKPKSAYMLILNLGDGRGLLLYRSLALHGKLIFWLKDRIDRRFVKRFSGK